MIAQCKTLAHTSIINSFVNNISFHEGKSQFCETFMTHVSELSGVYTFFGSYI